jgi:hypothetical protein
VAAGGESDVGDEKALKEVALTWIFKPTTCCSRARIALSGLPQLYSPLLAAPLLSSATNLSAWTRLGPRGLGKLGSTAAVLVTEM